MDGDVTIEPRSEAVAEQAEPRDAAARTGRTSAVAEPAAEPVADVVRPLVDELLGPLDRVELWFWDGSRVPAAGATTDAVIRFTSPDALRRVVWMPNELGLARAYVAGEVDLDGSLEAVVSSLRRPGRHRPSARRIAPIAYEAARRLHLLGRPLPPPPEEARLGGWRHSRVRDARAIGHHYDVGNDFYALVLGSSMTYSCARFVEPTDPLEVAQTAKHDLVCRKLGLHERSEATMLDVGCGWGSLAIHAASVHGARVVGITISREQAEWARRRVVELGLGGRVEIRLQDYRELGGETFDAVSSVGMSEHVGHGHLAEYFTSLRAAVRPGGRVLNHAISSVGGSRLGRTSFVGRYVFPDGELVDVGETVLAMERAGFEVRDVESLREHYARTLRCWIANLESNWDRAVDLVGTPRARIWQLYMTGSAIGFTDGGISVHQVLGVVPHTDGRSGMPSTRRSFDPHR